jgi:hypothetical protein
MKNSNTTITPQLNNKVLIITEKPSQLQRLIETPTLKTYLNTKTDVQHYSTVMISSFVFDYPKNIKYKEYPKSNNLSFKLNPTDFTEGELRYNQKENTNIEFFSGFEELIIFPDPDHTGVYSAILTLEKVLGENWKDYFKKVIYIKLFNYEPEHIEKHINKLLSNNGNNALNIENESDFKELYLRGKIKRYFEYNYNINSNIFFKEILKKDNIKIDFTISKHTIMAFYKFYNITEAEGIEEYGFQDALQKHIGSGKYTQSELIWCYGIGGVASRWQLLQNLIDLKFIERKVVSKRIVKRDIYDNNMKIVGTKEVEVEDIKLFKTDTGHKFLKLLSKKIYDTDLTFRLNNWMLISFSEAKSQIDKYLIEMFKPQKRKNKHL